MNQLEREEIGFMKFSGDGVLSGVIDAGSAGLALVGLDETIRFFNEKQSPEFAKLDYQIPVRTTEGSWMAWILAPAALAGGAFALSYLKKAGEKMAENDFKEIGLKDVLKKSINAIQFLIRLVKHTKRLQGWDVKNISWRNNNSEIGILNSNGEVIYLPIEYFRWFESLPPHIVSKITSVVAQDRSLSIGVRLNNEFEEVTVNVEEKTYFSSNEIEFDEEYLFPELKHGDIVKLEGKLTRGNESSNSIGFEYENHILNCIPESGSIRRYKPALFLRCIVQGTITRMSKQRMVSEKRPTIIIQNIIPLEEDDQYNLLLE